MITGWRPRRTIIFASWDAEEFGLLGSTEWAEVSKTKKIIFLVNREQICISQGVHKYIPLLNMVLIKTQEFKNLSLPLLSQ